MVEWADRILTRAIFSEITINNATSEIMQTYAFKMGLSEGRFAYATAADLVQSMISVGLILISNKVAKKVTGEGIF